MKNIFYPGSFWKKRLSQICVVFLIGPNFVMDGVQNDLLEVSEKMIDASEQLTETAVHSADLIKQHVYPVYDLLEHPDLKWVIEYFEIRLPDRRLIENGVGDVYRFRDTLGIYAPMFKTAAKIIRIWSALMWVPIILSLLWIFLDLCYGKAKKFVAFMLLVALPVNIYAYGELNSLVEKGTHLSNRFLLERERPTITILPN